MLGRPRRVGVAYGEAGRDPIGDEAGGTLHEHPDTGMEGFKAGHRWLTEDLPMNLKLSNRPVRTRMPGGVAGVPPIREAPYADARPRHGRTSALGPSPDAPCKQSALACTGGQQMRFMCKRLH